MSTWRKTYKVHPVADLFPMMSDDELAKLGEDIKTSGLRSSIVLSADGILLDGRNRLEAMERAGVALQQWHTRTFGDGDPVAFIVSSNIRRRHLNKQQQANLIVAALKATEKPRTDCAVSAEPHHGGRGKVNAVKQRAIAEGKKYDIGQRTIEKALAKATPRPKPKPVSERGHTIMKRPLRSKSGPVYSAGAVDAARQHYIRHAELVEDLDVEQEIIREAFHKIAGKRAIAAKAPDLDIPAFLDRKRALSNGGRQ